MKKILLVFCLLLLIGCSKETRNVDSDEFKGLDELITIEYPSNYIKGGDYMQDDTTYKLEEDYYTEDTEVYFQVQILSFKDIDVFSDENDKIDYKNYVNSLNHKEELKIDNETFYIGYRGSEELEDTHAQAYVKAGNYVIEFMTINSDELITKDQYNEFVSILKTIKFK